MFRFPKSSLFFIFCITSLISPSAPAQVDFFSDPAADYGVAALVIAGSTDQSGYAPLGGIEADVSGDYVFLAANGNVGATATATASRMIRFRPANVTLRFDGLVNGATAGSPVTDYLRVSDLSLVDASPAARDHRDSSILGMGIDRNTNDLYAAVQGATHAILRLGIGASQVGSLVEFAAPGTQPQALRPYAPDFSSILMGPECVAHVQHPSATDVYFFTDGTLNDFCLSWAAEDLPYLRTGLSPTSFQNQINVSDSDFFTDELRIHATILAGDYHLTDPTIHSKVAFLPVANRMAFCTGRDSADGVFLVNDLNDNTELAGPNPDFPQVSVVLTHLNPSTICNLYDGGQLDGSDLLVADYDSANDRTSIVLVSFSSTGTVNSEQTLDLTTPNNALPGRISELAMDRNGTIYAVDGDNGLIYALAQNGAPPPPTPTPSPTPIIPSDFSCFTTNAFAGGHNTHFTPDSLIQYARVTLGQPNVMTKMELIGASGDLENYLPRGLGDHRRFYYVNRPIVLTSFDQLTVSNGDWFIFRGDGAARAFLQVEGKLKSDAIKPYMVREDYRTGSDDPEEDEIRYTSVAGFVSWLKRQGVANWGDLNWTAPPGDIAAQEFEAFASAAFGVVAATPEVLVNQMRVSHNGRWGGIYFKNSDVGTSAETASQIYYSRVEFAEVGIYCQNFLQTFTPTTLLTRDENTLRIFASALEYNLIGLSLDSYAPLVASNKIRRNSQDMAFDGRQFGQDDVETPWDTACGLTPGQRFPVGSSGSGVFITKRFGNSQVSTVPLLTMNDLSGNERSGVVVQQPGVPDAQGVSFGIYRGSLNRPQPLMGRTVFPVTHAHEFSDMGMNILHDNTSFNIEYLVKEIPTDGGVASTSHLNDMGAMSNIFGIDDLDAVKETILDGIDFGDLGEVILGRQTTINGASVFRDGPIGYIPTGVESSTENYK